MQSEVYRSEIQGNATRGSAAAKYCETDTWRDFAVRTAPQAAAAAPNDRVAQQYMSDAGAVC
jgi:hypothetical protein